VPGKIEYKNPIDFLMKWKDAGGKGKKNCIIIRKRINGKVRSINEL